MRFCLRKSELRLKPPVSLLPRHTAGGYHPIQGNMCFLALAAQIRIGQCPHGPEGIPVRSYIAVAERITGADIELRIRVIRPVPIDYRGRPQKRLGTTVLTFDIDSLHRIISSPSCSDLHIHRRFCPGSLHRSSVLRLSAWIRWLSVSARTKGRPESFVLRLYRERRSFVSIFLQRCCVI